MTIVYPIDMFLYISLCKARTRPKRPLQEHFVKDFLNSNIDCILPYVQNRIHLLLLNYYR